MKIAVCENDNKILDTLSRIIKEVFTSFNFGVEIKNYAEFKPCEFDAEDDAFVLYIINTRLNGQSGLEFAKRLRRAKVKAYLIFISDSARYALDSYDVGAYFYFLTPPDECKFEFVIRKIAAKLCMPSEKIVTLRRSSKVFSILTSSIVRVKSDAHSINIRLKDGQEIVFSMKLDDFTVLLENAPEFVRIHKSYLLNANFIQSMDAYEAVIDGERFSVSRAMKAEALKAYKSFTGV